MGRKKKATTDSNDQVLPSPKDLVNGTEASTSTRGRRKKVMSGQSELNGMNNSKKVETSSEKTEKEMIKEVQVKITRCDEFDELDKLEPQIQAEQKRLKISARKNIKKVKDISKTTGSIKSNNGSDIGTTPDAVVSNNSNQVDEIKIKSKTGSKRKKESNGNNSSKATDVETDDFIEPNSKTTRKKMKNAKSEGSSQKATEHAQENEKPKTRTRKLKNSEDNITKISEDNVTEKDDEVASSSKLEDEVKPKSKTSAKTLKNSKRTKKSTVQESSEKLNNDVTKEEIDTKKGEGSQENFETLKYDDSELPVDVAEKENKTISNKTGKGSKRKRGEQNEDVKDVKPTKSAKKEDSDEFPGEKNSKEKSPEAPEIVKPNQEITCMDLTLHINIGSENSEENIETSKSNDSELHAVTEKVTNVPNKTDKGSKRKRGKQVEGDEDVKPSKSAKNEKAPGKSKSSKEQIPGVTGDFSNDSKSWNGNMWNFKISSWNVNGIRAWLEKNGLSYVRHENPDILCIQETRCSDDKLPEEVKEMEGYHTYWLSGDKDGYSGVCLLSKQEPIKVEYGIGISQHDLEGRVITAEYDKFYLVAAYVPNAGRKLVRLDYRKQWDVDFRAYIKKLDTKKPVILCGDLNVAHEEIDLANPKGNKRNAGFTIEERDGFSALLKEGFTDTFRQLYPNETGAYTFWTYMLNARAKNVGWRLDYFVVSERFCENLCDNVIRKDVLGSDHCPITLFLSL